MAQHQDTDIPEKYFSERRSSPAKWVPIILSLSAFLVAGFFADTEDIQVRRFAGAYFGYGLGIAMILWSVFNIREGRIRGRSRHYYRDANPRIFVFLILFKNVIPALCCFVVGLVFTFGPVN